MNVQGSMTDMKPGRVNIVLPERLEVDWGYQPENPLGKRAWARLATRELYILFGAKVIPVKVVAKSCSHSGYLLDISQKGLAVLLPGRLPHGEPVRVGMYLGKKKVVSRALVRNVSETEGGYRTGIQFVDLEKNLERYIAGLAVAGGFRS